MFSVDNFYKFMHEQTRIYLNADLKCFNKHGSRDLQDLIVPSYPEYSKIKRLSSQAIMFDQEPIQLEYFMDWIDFDPNSFPPGYEYRETGNLYKNLSPIDFVFYHLSSIEPNFICHSEVNSVDLDIFKTANFIPIHYFYHGLISRDWFRHWKHNLPDYASNHDEIKRFGIYARDASGSRQYRLDLLHDLAHFDVYYKMQLPIYELDPTLVKHYDLNNNIHDSNSSAKIDMNDVTKFSIHLVAETLFNTQKTHLTEKVFKAIVMKQPFIIIGCPNSLKYLKQYGFKTFSGLWDESYDEEMIPAKRMEKILNLISYLNNLSKPEFNTLLCQAKSILTHNHQHFFSEKFETTMLEELYLNLSKAYNESLKINQPPGGNYLKYMNMLHKQGHDITNFNRKRIADIITYAASHEARFGSIIKQYPDISNW